MNNNIDKMIFILSTECFCHHILKPISENEILLIQRIARSMIPTIVDGGDNYFMCADFSSSRLNKTHTVFFKTLTESAINEVIINAISTMLISMDDITPAKSLATSTFLSVISRLYWLDSDQLTSPITEELVVLISMVEKVGLTPSEVEEDWREKWLASPSDWDAYIMSLMDGISNAPYLWFLDATAFYSQFQFLKEWKEILGPENFTVVKSYAFSEAHKELDGLDQDAAKELDCIDALF